MKRIVFTTWGSYGDIHPFMALALELQERGHTSVIAASPIYREKIEAAGIEFHPVRPDLPSPDDAASAEMIRRALDPIEGPRYVFRELLNPYLRETYTDTLDAVTEDGGADLLVAHQVPLATPLVAEKTGIKRISCVLAPIAFASVFDPPTPPQLPALRSLIAFHPAIARVLMGIGKWSMNTWTKPVQELRKELGLPPSVSPIFEGQYSPLGVLALFSPLLAQVQRDFPPKTTITGFPFYDKNDVTPVPLELKHFLDEGEPPIVFTLGSSAVWISKDFYANAAKTAQILGRRAVLLIGDNRNLPDFDLPEGVAAFDYAPHSMVMPRSSVIVHQCGIGTTGQALRAGRPMLIVPHGQDQPDNARRCVELGIARTMSPRAFTAKRAAREISKLLDDPSYAENARIVGEKIRNENGTKNACDVIENVLEVA